jgi:hypothetical protein
MGNISTALPLTVNLPRTRNGGVVAIEYQDREQGMRGSLPVRMSYTLWT